jgi:hypothetical protein
MKIRTALLALLLATLLLAACGGGLNGTYTDSMGVASYTFKSGGKVEMSAMGASVEMPYEVDGNKVKIKLPGGAAQVLTINPDGSIAGPGGIKLTRKG